MLLKAYIFKYIRLTHKEEIVSTKTNTDYCHTNEDKETCKIAYKHKGINGEDFHTKQRLNRQRNEDN